MDVALFEHMHYYGELHYSNRIFKLLTENCVKICVSMILTSGGRLNKKDGLTRYGDSHVKDKTS